MDIGKPIRQHRGRLRKKDLLEKTVRVASKQEDCRAILIAFDADDDCPKDVKESLEHLIQAACPQKCRIVIPKREYEAWFLASMESLRGRRYIRPDATSHASPESIRGAKEAVERQMIPGHSYMETVDQAALSAAFDMKQAYLKCRSFKRLVNIFGELIRGMGIEIAEWPPQEWLEKSE